jgi:hypothetical protein
MLSAAMPSPALRALPVLLLALIGLGACSEPSTESEPDAAARADSIVQAAIAQHGGDVLDHAVVRFDFRGIDFRVERNGGQYHYQRTYTDSLGRTVREILSNDSLYRAVDGERVSLTEDEQSTVRVDVNSVTYFALLPYFLRDAAVQTAYSGTDTIDGTPYHRIRVTFQQQGGGQDWQDVFMYWFAQDDLGMDYLAYAYGFGPDEAYGTRFREAYDIRTIEGVRFADYMNYTTPGDSLRDLTRYPDYFAGDSLELVSRIETDSVRVQPLES